MDRELRPLVVRRINKFKKFVIYLLLLNVLYKINHHYSDIKRVCESYLIVNDEDYSEYDEPITGILSYF